MNPPDSGKPSNAQSALLDYYDDVLGSLSSDPLEQLENEDREAQSKLPSRNNTKKTYQVGLAKTHKKTVKKKLPTTFYDASYESKLKADIVAPLIIPSVFPKLAPQQVDAALTKKPDEQPLERSQPVSSVVTINEEQDVTGPAAILESRAKDSLPNNKRPSWAEERFECLLFTVAGLQLAVPLTSLGAIYKIENDFTPLVGRASWFMGLYHRDGRNIRVVDTAKLVMPERVIDTTREAYQYIIRLGGNNWGMACDAVQESIQLSPEAVQWRTQRTKRAWLSGTVIEHMCALIDVTALSDLLKKEALSKHSLLKS